VAVVPPVVSASPIPGQQVFTPSPVKFPAPGSVGVLGKADLFSSSGVSPTDPTLLGQISFVEGLYQGLLGRSADDVGMLYWVRQLRSGMTRDAVVQAFWTSPDHRALQIQALYETYLGRDPGADGIAYWQQVFAGGATENQVAAAIITSPEYLGAHPDSGSLIAALYQTVLGRPVDAGGLAAWQGIYASQGALGVALGILNSDEANVRMLNLVFANFLGRGMQAGEQEFWLSRIHSGVTPGQVAEILLGTDEFYNRALQAIQG
jgi:hypothetical protein